MLYLEPGKQSILDIFYPLQLYQQNITYSLNLRARNIFLIMVPLSKVFIVGSLFFSLTILANANELPLESILVTANVPSQQSNNRLEHVDTISISDIRIQNPRDMLQLLDGFKGVFASREGGPGRVNTLSIRGAEPNFTVVLIDGVPVNDPTNTRGGSFDLTTLSSIHVRSVALTKGPGSLAYGSDALAGVLKITTAPEKEETSGVRLYHETQGYGGFRNAGAATLANKRQAFSVQVTKDDSGDIWQGGGRELAESAAHYRLSLEHGLLQLGGREANFKKTAYPEQSGGPMFAKNEDMDQSEGLDQSGYLGVEISLLPNWRLAGQYSFYSRELEYHSPGIAPYDRVPEQFYDANYQRKQWRLVSELSYSNSSLNFGTDRRREQGDSDGAVIFPSIPLDALGFFLNLPSAPVETGFTIPVSVELDTKYNLRRNTEGRFVELNWQSKHAVVLSAGIRHDITDGDREVVRRFLASIPLWEWGRVNLSYSEGFKLPSFFALGHGLVGNPELKPERVESYQLDVSAQWGRIGFEISLFESDYVNLIDYDADTFSMVNRDSVHSRGGELALSARWENWTLLGSVSHVDINIKNDHRNLANRPQNIAVLDLNWRPNARFSWHNRLRWIDKQFATSLHEEESREYELDDYLLVDSVVRWKAKSFFDLTLGLENVGNTHYQEAVGFPGPGRLLRLGFTFNL